MLCVAYDTQDGTKRLGVVEAANKQFAEVVRSKGFRWAGETCYSLDRALIDFMCANFAWLEFDGVKLVEEGTCGSCEDEQEEEPETGCGSPCGLHCEPQPECSDTCETHCVQDARFIQDPSLAMKLISDMHATSASMIFALASKPAK